MIFLGILLDGKNLRLAVLIEKRNKAVHLLQEMCDRKKAKVKDLQVFCGYLNFLGKAIFPGRTFTRRMYSKYSHLINCVPGGRDSSQSLAAELKLKQHYHVRLDSEFKMDCKVWLEFLTGPSLQDIINRPMVDVRGHINASQEIFFYSDASAARTLGFGCVLDTKWLRETWVEGFIETNSPSIEYLELLALCAGIFTWENEPQLTNARIAVFCDNVVVVHMVNSMSSKCEECMYLLRMLALNNLKFNRRVSARYVKSKDNVLSDALSRGQMERFR